MKKFFKKVGNSIKQFFKKLGNLLKNKWLRKGTSTIIIIAIIIASYIFLNWGVDQIRIGDIDFSKDKKYSLTDVTREKLKELKTNIEIELINIDQNIYIEDSVDQFKKASKTINVTKIDNITERVDLQTKYGIQPNDFAVVVKNGEKNKVLRIEDFYTFISGYNAEFEPEKALLNAIIDVTIDQKPKLYVLGGHTYYSPEKTLGIIATTLQDEGNEIEMLNLATIGKIPEDCKCLVLTTLETDYTDFERDKILEYINNGGNILMLSSQGILLTEMPNLNQILDVYGVKLSSGIVIEQDSKKMFYDNPSMIFVDTNPSYMKKLNKNFKLFMANAGNIEITSEEKQQELGVTYEILGQSSEKSFVRTKNNIETTKRTEQDSEEKPSIVALSANKKLDENKNSEIIIFSDETFITPTNIENLGFIGKMYSNEDVVVNSVSHLTKRDDTILIRNPEKERPYSVTEDQMVIIKTIIFSVPVLIMIYGIGVMVYRKNRI